MKRAANTAIFLGILTAVFLHAPASSAAVYNGGAYLVPKSLALGQTLHVQNVIVSSEALANVSVSYEIHRLTDLGAMSPSVVFSKKITGQNFTAAERKQFTWDYAVPSNLVSGTYTFVIKVTGASGSPTYLNVQGGPVVEFQVAGLPSPSYVRGVNIMDLGQGNIPGRYNYDYVVPSLESLQNLEASGLNVVRVNFSWERIQRTLGGPLDATDFGRVMQVLRDAKTAGIKVILDMHNYARYKNASTGVSSAFGSSTGPTEAQFTDVWKKIAAAVKADPQAAKSLYAYGLMNEPYSLTALTGSLSPVVPVAGFESTVEGWLPRVATTTTLTRVVRGSQGSLNITANALAGSSLVFGAKLPPSIKRTGVTSGATFRIKGNVPSTTPGTSIKVRMLMANSSFQQTVSAPLTVTKGQDFVLYYTPPAAQWPNNQGISIEFVVDGSDGSQPFVFYVDDVSQGTLVGAKTGPQIWESYSQAAVSGIRSIGDSSLIMVGGYAFSSASGWPTYHPVKWINDPSGKIIYEAHVYLDDDTSGKYAHSHGVELSLAQGQGFATVGARGVARIKKFADWVATQKVRGFVGEVGWPNTNKVGAADGAAWSADGEEFMSFLDSVHLGATLWTTGTWQRADGNILNVYLLNPFTPLSPANVLEDHLGLP